MFSIAKLLVIAGEATLRPNSFRLRGARSGERTKVGGACSCQRSCQPPASRDAGQVATGFGTISRLTVLVTWPVLLGTFATGLFVLKFGPRRIHSAHSARLGFVVVQRYLFGSRELRESVGFGVFITKYRIYTCAHTRARDVDPETSDSRGHRMSVGIDQTNTQIGPLSKTRFDGRGMDEVFITSVNNAPFALNKR